MAAPTKRQRRGWGHVRQFPSTKPGGGRWQASYIHGPNLTRHLAPERFDSRLAAEGWLAAERRLIELGAWTPPKERAARVAAMTFGAYAEQFLAERTGLTPKTASVYRHLLDSRLLPTLRDVRLTELTIPRVRAWWAQLPPKTRTTNAHAWDLLRTILNQAVTDELITVNPTSAIKGLGKRSKRADVVLLTPAELRQVTARLPASYRLAAPVSAWCGLRFGELIELRRGDVVDDGTTMVLRIRRAAVRVDKKIVVGPPKTEAGIRDVHVPATLAAELRAHIATLGRGGPKRFIFTSSRGNRLSQAVFRSAFKRALPPGKERMRVHDLRHTGAVWAAQAGATTAELMGRFGHTTAAMAMHYQHVAAGRDAEIAARLAQMDSAATDAPAGPDV